MCGFKELALNLNVFGIHILFYTYMFVCLNNLMETKLIILALLVVVSFSGSLWFGLKKKRKESDKRLMFFLLGLFGILLNTLVLHYFGTSNTHFLVVYASLLFFPMCLTLSPSMYLYVVSLFENLEARNILAESIKHYYLSIGLWVLNTFVYLALYIVSTDHELYGLLNQTRTFINFFALFVVFILQVIYYPYLCLKIHKKRRNIVKTIADETSMKVLDWMLQFTILFIITMISIYTFMIPILEEYKVLLRIYLILFLLYTIYRGLKNETYTLEIERQELLDRETLKRISQKLERHMKETKAFLKHDLTVKLLASDIGTNAKYLSYVINSVFNKNFSSYINSYRIDNAKDLLVSNDHDNVTIEYIANMTGFKSKSSFNTAFRKLTEMTPTEYKALVKKA